MNLNTLISRNQTCDDVTVDKLEIGIEAFRQRIDIFITDLVNKNIYLADMRCPIDIRQRFEGGRNQKHYAHFMGFK